MSIKCLLCDGEFSAITNSHLKYMHEITTYDYYKMFPRAEFVSEETRQLLSALNTGNTHALGFRQTEEARQLISVANERRVISEETRQRMSKSQLGNENALGFHHTEEAKQRISELLTGHVISEETRQRMSESKVANWKDPECARKMSESRVDFQHTEVSRRRLSESMTRYFANSEARQRISEVLTEKWKDSEFAHYMSKAQHRRPNGPELQLHSVLDRYFPDEWKYTGDGTFWVEGRNPDFININGKKCVIEIFGYHWHDPEYFPNRPTEEELIAHYREFGYDCIVFWEYDVYNEEVVNEILQRRKGDEDVGM